MCHVKHLKIFTTYRTGRHVAHKKTAFGGYLNICFINTVRHNSPVSI